MKVKLLTPAIKKLLEETEIVYNRDDVFKASPDSYHGEAHVNLEEVNVNVPLTDVVVLDDDGVAKVEGLVSSLKYYQKETETVAEALKEIYAELATVWEVKASDVRGYFEGQLIKAEGKVDALKAVATKVKNG